ncbi:MAG: ATP-grasp domain-containing protein [Rubrivivax sp.]|nr:ATP-grasp domain-containing protein [Rubrivivax sp.]
MADRRLLHVLGGGPWQLPTVKRARELGYRVLVTDMYRERPAYALADLHEVVDITDLDATLAVARRYRVDGILCDTTDVGVPTAAYVAERLGLPGMGYETALNFTDKARMRERTGRAGLRQVRHDAVDSLSGLQAAAAQIGLPAVVKPVDSQSGRGVTIVLDSSTLETAWNFAVNHSRLRRVIVEQLVEGTEVIVDGLVVDGNVMLLTIATKTPYADNPTISSRICYLSGEHFERIRPILEPANRSVIAALGLRTGIFHAEYMLSGGDVVPIDVAARGGGVTIYRHVLPHVSGVDAMSTVIRLAMGEPVRLQPSPIRRGASIDFLRMPEGRLTRIEGAEAAAQEPGIAALHFNVGAGDTVGPLLHKDDRPGFIVALAETSDAAVDCAERAKAHLRVFMGSTGDPVPVH